MLIQFEKNVINFFPDHRGAKSRALPQVSNYQATYYDQCAAVPKLVKGKRCQEGLHYVPG
jgi:hypothetical protein